MLRKDNKSDLTTIYLMKMTTKRLIFVIAAFALATSFFSETVRADQIQFYKIYTVIDEEGRSFVNLTLTFEKPEKRFQMNIIGRIENFEASSNAGPVDCNVEISGISSIDCQMNLTETKRELRLSFETVDFIKVLDEKVYFSGEFTPNMDTSIVSASIQLPKNYLPIGEDISSSVLTYSENASAHILGNSILITWRLSNIRENEKLKFEILYEQVNPPLWFQLRMRHFILFGGTFAVIVGFIVVRHLRKSEKVVLSVLDEYERKVVDIISNEGEVKQRKVVELTNLSKAKVSRVVKSLKERGLIEVERRGRTNKLKLVKKKLKI